MNRSNAPLGVALIVLMTICFATMDNAVKYSGAFVPVLLVLWLRYGFQAAAMTLWLARPGSAGFRAVHPKFQLLRGALLLFTSAMSFYGVQSMPVAEFSAINMLTPVLVTLMSAGFLHERVSPLRWLLVVGGFSGALIVIRPGSGLFGAAVAFPLAGAASYAVFQVLTSKLSGVESPYTTHFYTGATGFAILTPIVWASGIDVAGTLQAAGPALWWLMALIGACGTAGHLLLIFALGLAPASTLMPFVYLNIATSALVGWIVFRYVPDGWAWVGMGVVGLCGAASAWLNVRDSQRVGRDAAANADVIAD